MERVQMTLEEAIRYHEEEAKKLKEHKKDIEIILGAEKYKEVLEEHRQYAEWLKELAERRKQPEIIRCYECVHASDIVPIPNPNLRHCDKCGFFKSKDYFCGDAERRNDG